jgi:hypothetical protein
MGSQGNAASPENLPRARSILPGAMVFQERAHIPKPGLRFRGTAVSRSFLRSQEHLGEYGWNIGCIRYYAYGGRSSRENIRIRDHIVRVLLSFSVKLSARGKICKQKYEIPKSRKF